LIFKTGKIKLKREKGYEFIIFIKFIKNKKKGRNNFEKEINDDSGTYSG
jgi:hypothetical protein